MKKSNLKKYAVIAISLLAIMVVGVSIAAAQGPAGNNAPAGPPAQGVGTAFVDEDGDGQCDLMGTGQAGQGYGPRGFGAQGANFVDEDGDGVCDLVGSDLMGTGAGYGPGGNGAQRANFVDEDGDGVCDLMGTGVGHGSGGNGACGDNFVDEDGDGICDLAGSGQVGNSFGRGMGRGVWGASAAQ